jgi:hypothetical protein
MERVVHVNKDPFDVYIGRPNRRAGLAGSVWANPFRIGDPHPETGAPIQRGEAVELFKEWIARGEGRCLLKQLGELEGKTLGCWCAKKGGVGTHGPVVCHGQILLLLLDHRRRVMERKRTQKEESIPKTRPDTRPGEKKRRYIFCGSRDWDETTQVRECLERLPEGAVVVVSGARGADRIAEAAARRMGLEVEVYPAPWEKEGKGAGFRRNERMLALEGILGVFAFRVRGRSNGTDHMVRIAREAGVQTEVTLPAKLPAPSR